MKGLKPKRSLYFTKLALRQEVSRRHKSFQFRTSFWPSILGFSFPLFSNFAQLASSSQQLFCGFGCKLVQFHPAQLLGRLCLKKQGSARLRACT